MGKNKGEKEPKKCKHFNLEINHEIYKCTDENTFAYLYEDEQFDHIFHATKEVEDGYLGIYIWRNSVVDFDSLIKYMINNDFIVKNEEAMHELDYEAWQMQFAQDQLKTFELTPRQEKVIAYLGYLLEKDLLTADDFQTKGELYI